MAQLERNRVFLIDEIKDLQEKSDKIFNKADDLIKNVYTYSNNIKSLYNNIPSDTKYIELDSDISSIIKLIDNAHFNTVHKQMNKTLKKITEHVPQYDTNFAQSIDSIVSITNSTIKEINSIKDLINTVNINKNYDLFIDKIDDFTKKLKENKTKYRSTLKEIKSELNGLEISSCEYSCDPVNLATGNFALDNIDISINGAYPLIFRRMYNSLEETISSLGKGWTHNFDINMTIDNVLEQATITLEDSHKEIFYIEDNKFIPLFNKNSSLNKIDSGFIFKSSNNNIYLFDTDGNCLKYEDSKGVLYEFEYEDNKLCRISNKCGQILLKYNEEGLLKEIHDGLDRKQSYIYDDFRLTKVCSESGESIIYSYDIEGNIKDVKDGNKKLKISNVFDDKNRTTEQTFPDGSKMHFKYNDEEKYVEVKERNGSITKYYHDELFRTSKIVSSNGFLEYKYNDKGQRTEYKDKMGNVTRYEYNSFGDITKVIDSYENYIKLYYDKNRMPVMMKNKDGSVKRNVYNTKGLLIRTIDSLGRSIGYKYDNTTNPRKIFLPDSSEYKFGYDNRENVTSITNPMGNKIQCKYDKLNRVIENIDANGNKTMFEYDRDNNLTRLVNAEGNCRCYKYKNGNLIELIDFDESKYLIEYNSFNQVSKVTNPLKQITRYKYDAMGNLIEIIEPNKASTKYQYDEFDNVIAKIDCYGNIERYEYDANNNLIVTVNKKGLEKHYKYDKLNRLIEMTDATGTIKKKFDTMGRVIELNNSNGNHMHFEYNSAGELIKKYDDFGNSVEFSYNILGLIEEYTDSQGNITSYDYYPGGKLKRITKQTGVTIEYEYDNNGNIICQDISDSLRINYKYDSLNRLIEIVDSENRSKKYKYDALNNLVAYIDENNNEYKYEYKPMNLLSKITDPEGNKFTYEYDLNNKLISSNSIKDNNVTNIFSYKRDLLGRVTEIIDSLGYSEKYDFDEIDNIVKYTNKNNETIDIEYNNLNKVDNYVINNSKMVQFYYNEINQISKMIDENGVTTFKSNEQGFISEVVDYNNKSVKYSYDKFGHRKSIEYPNGINVSYDYDNFNNLISLDNGKVRINYDYDKFGRVINKKLSNGINTRIKYDSVGNIDSIINSNNSGVFEQFDYKYDNCGNKTQVNVSTQFTNNTVNYNYDKLNRLTQSTKDNNIIKEYFYDNLGNRIKSIEGSIVKNYLFNSESQLLSVCDNNNNKEIFNYDNNGNVVKTIKNDMEIHEYKYNTLGNMIEYDNNTVKYNGLGFKIEDNDDLYILDMTKNYNNMLMKNDNTYYWDGHLIGENDKIFSLNEQGTPTNKFDEQGRFIESYNYDEFGNSNGKISSNIGYVGFESKGNLYFANARLYNPKIGRFMSKDKIRGFMSMPQSLNQYSYCYNNSLKYVDLDGNLAFVDNICNTFVNGAKEIGSFANSSVRQVTGAINNVVGYGKDKVEKIVSITTEAANYATSKMNNVIHDTVDSVSDYIDNKIVTPVSNYIDNNIVAPITEFVDFSKNIINNGLDFITNIKNEMKLTCGIPSLNYILEELNYGTGGSFKTGIKAIITNLAHLGIPEKIKQAFESFVPPIVRNISDISIKFLRKKLFAFAKNHNIESVFSCKALTWLLGFEYDPIDDVYHTQQGSLQEDFGFGQDIDELGPLLGMDLFEEYIVFQYNGREFLLEPWMGKYGFGNCTGAELGIYSRSIEEANKHPFRTDMDNSGIYYDSAAEDEQLSSKTTLYDSDFDHVIFENDTDDYIKDKDTFWNLAIKCLDGSKKENLIAKTEIRHSDINYLLAMKSSLEKNKNIKNVHLDKTKGVLTYTWDPNKLTK